jgi:hypothetical protein
MTCHSILVKAGLRTDYFCRSSLNVPSTAAQATVPRVAGETSRSLESSSFLVLTRMAQEKAESKDILPSNGSAVVCLPTVALSKHDESVQTTIEDWVDFARNEGLLSPNRIRQPNRPKPTTEVLYRLGCQAAS